MSPRPSFVRRLFVTSGLVLLCGCATTNGLSNVPDHFIMRDMVDRVGAFAIVPEADAQPIVRGAPSEVREAMLAMSWLGAREPAGTFLIWSNHLPGGAFTPTLAMQLQGDVKGSGGCEVVDWAQADDVTNWSGMLATMDGSRGGGFYMASLSRFTARQQGFSAGGIFLCPTANPSTVEVYSMDHNVRWAGEAHDASAELFAGTFTVDVPAVKQWIVTNGKAGHFVIKAAKAPPVDDWVGPKPVPSARRQELLIAK